jgi:hypothetical protein
MADVLTLTTNAFNSADVPQYYDDLFLERAMMNMTYDVLFSERDVPENSGKVVFFDRMTPRAVATTALTEATTPSAVSTSSTQVSATLAEYGDYEKVSSLFELTTFDKGLKDVSRSWDRVPERRLTRFSATNSTPERPSSS